MAQLTKVQNSPYYRTVTMWERLPAMVQKETTKVKLKKDVQKIIG